MDTKNLPRFASDGNGGLVEVKPQHNKPVAPNPTWVSANPGDFIGSSYSDSGGWLYSYMMEDGRVSWESEPRPTKGE